MSLQGSRAPVISCKILVSLVGMEFEGGIAPVKSRQPQVIGTCWGGINPGQSLQTGLKMVNHWSHRGGGERSRTSVGVSRQLGCLKNVVTVSWEVTEAIFGIWMLLHKAIFVIRIVVFIFILDNSFSDNGQFSVRPLGISDVSDKSYRGRRVSEHAKLGRVGGGGRGEAQALLH